MVSESRIATYIGIAKGELPDSAYFGQWRTFPDTCDWSWQETKPIGVDRTYAVQGATNGEVTVFEGAYPYENYLTVPGWGGSMFEALMPNLFVPEETWAPQSWKINHPGTVEAQIHHGLVDAQYGYWGFSPSDIPEGGYDVFGVDAIGLNPEGYPSNEQHTFVDHGFAGCRPGQPDPPPSAYTNGVVTPHAAFLALRYAPKAGDGESRQPAGDPGHVRGLGIPGFRQRPDRSIRTTSTSRWIRASSWARSGTLSGTTCFVRHSPPRRSGPR